MNSQIDSKGGNFELCKLLYSKRYFDTRKIQKDDLIILVVHRASFLNTKLYSAPKVVIDPCSRAPGTPYGCIHTF